jgi:hypothetical protein
MIHSPTIVVVAFNRPKSLERLLFSLSNAKNISNTRLIISIDNKEPENKCVKDMADAFKWPYGEKEVIYQPKRLGLKNHVLQCGDLSQKYGSVIILEDDLFVSPYFYDFAVKALEYYGDDNKIGGISLFNYPYEDLMDLPFSPIRDESDVYFVQFPSSLGQAWTARHWNDFRKWLENEPDLKSISISEQVYTWPETSWKKLFSAFLVEKDKYFVFPRISLTTNFNDKGTHKSLDVNHNGQTQLKLFDADLHLKNFQDSYCIYDAHFELDARTVKQFCPELANFDFEMDLYGHKEKSRIKSTYIITSRTASKSILQYQRKLKPHEMNILLGLKGKELSLCHKDDIIPVKKKFAKMLADYKYFIDSSPVTLKFSIYSRLKRIKYLSKLF